MKKFEDLQKKITSNGHTTISSKSVRIICHYASKNKDVKKFNPGVIKFCKSRLGGGTPKLKFKEMNGGIRIKVVEGSVSQEVLIYSNLEANILATMFIADFSKRKKQARIINTLECSEALQ